MVAQNHRASVRLHHCVLNNKGICDMSSLIRNPEVLSSASDKAKLFGKNFCKDSNLDDSGIFLPRLPYKSNLKLQISVTPNMVKKVIANLVKRYHWKCMYLKMIGKGL